MTPRELEVLDVIRAGQRTLSGIARALNPPVSHRTVEVHVRSIADTLPADWEPRAPTLMRVVLWALVGPVDA